MENENEDNLQTQSLDNACCELETVFECSFSNEVSVQTDLTLEQLNQVYKDYDLRVLESSQKKNKYTEYINNCIKPKYKYV